MIGTITPMVYGNSQRRRHVIPFAHLIGATCGGILTGAMLASLGRLVHPAFGPGNLLVLVAVLALAYGMHEFRLIRLPMPQRHRQVPQRWGRTMPPSAAAALYGAGLGVGVLTHITTGTFYVMCVMVIALAEPFVGALVVGLYGCTRALPTFLLTVGSRDLSEAFRRHDRVATWDTRLVHVGNGLVLGVVGMYLGALIAWH